ncbi:MAG TPA: ABC transporter ATP-binding protein [Alphaproteobacteria bacterium]|nr:ABC transporter ATP-binding protein [Alphaproteobacteria bacterium]
MTATSPAGALLKVEGVSKRFGDSPAVDRVDLSVAPGELFALLGASGSGKTTLLRLIAGLERPDGGRVRIDGVDVTERPAYERPVNTVFQSYALFPHMSVRSNVAYGLKQENLPRNEIEKRVAEMLQLVQMEAFAHRRPSQLSGGQKQRVAIARSLAKRPKLLLLDEPMAALDRRLREQTRLELAAIQKRLGIAFILVTHDQEEAMSLADRMAVMEAGRIVQIGTPREIYARPATRSVAGFIGDTNLFEGRAIQREGSYLVIRLADGDMIVHDDAEIAPDTAVWLAVRPERLRLGAMENSNCLEVRVLRLEYRGDQSILHARTPRGAPVRLKGDNEALASLAPGATITVSCAPDDIVVLGR